MTSQIAARATCSHKLLLPVSWFRLWNATDKRLARQSAPPQKEIGAQITEFIARVCLGNEQNNICMNVASAACWMRQQTRKPAIVAGSILGFLTCHLSILLVHLMGLYSTAPKSATLSHCTTAYLVTVHLFFSCFLCCEVSRDLRRPPLLGDCRLAVGMVGRLLNSDKGLVMHGHSRGSIPGCCSLVVAAGGT